MWSDHNFQPARLKAYHVAFILSVTETDNIKYENGQK